MLLQEKKQQSNRAQSSIPRPPLRTKRSFFHPLCLLETPSTAECLLPNETHALRIATRVHIPRVFFFQRLLLIFSSSLKHPCLLLPLVTRWRAGRTIVSFLLECFSAALPIVFALLLIAPRNNARSFTTLRYRFLIDKHDWGVQSRNVSVEEQAKKGERK